MSEHRNKMSLWSGQVPFIRLMLPCIAGVISGVLIVPDVAISRILDHASCMVIILGCACVWRQKCLRMVFPLFLFLLCWQGVWRPHPDIDTKHFSRYESLALLGYLAEEPQIRERSVRVLFRVTEGICADSKDIIPLRGHLQLTLENGKDVARNLNYGTKLMIDAKFSEVNSPRNPGEMDYASHLAKKDCWHQAYVSKDRMTVIGQGTGSRLLAYAIDIRKTMISKFARYIENQDALAVASTLILGYRADLDRELIQTYSHTGTIHVLSVSGMHVVIIFWLFSRLLFWMDWHKSLKAFRFPLLILSLCAYSILTGLSPSVLRAALMLGFVLWAEALRRRSNTFNSIGASAFLLVLYQPKLLMDIGFQLSYLAVISIVGLYPFMRTWFVPKTKALRAVTDYSAMSVAAQAGAFPLAMYYFQQFPLYFLPANLLIVLPASLIMYLGFALLMLPETGPTIFILEILGFLLGQLIFWMNWALEGIQHLPGPDLTGIDTSIIQCIMLYIMILCLFFSSVWRSKIQFAGFIILAMLLSFSWTYTTLEKWQNRQVVIHQMRSALAISIVGQGQALLYSDLSTPDHPYLSFSVLPFLRTYVAHSAIRYVNVADSVYSDGIFYLEHGLIQAGKHRIYVYEESSAYWPDLDVNMVFPESQAALRVDVLLIRGNPRSSPERILTLFPCTTLVLDGSNNDFVIGKFVAKSQELGVKAYILKNNYAYVWVLDKEG